MAPSEDSPALNSPLTPDSRDSDSQEVLVKQPHSSRGEQDSLNLVLSAITRSTIISGLIVYGVWSVRSFNKAMEASQISGIYVQEAVKAKGWAANMLSLYSCCVCSAVRWNSSKIVL
jgi:hypothetical protein